MSDSSGFEDPKLKAAIARLWSAESAPAGLRDRMQREFSDAPAETYRQSQPRLILSRRNPFRWLGLAAAAAVMLGTLGIIRFLLLPPISSRNSIAALDQPVINALLATHDHCAVLSDHHFVDDVSAPSDFPAIAKTLNLTLRQPVLAASLGDDWNFRGAAVCPVGRCKSGHLVFSKRAKVISLFSLPPSECKSIRGDVDCELNGHCISGFARADGLYCVVGSSTDGSLRPEEVRQLRDRLRGLVAIPQEGSANAGRLTDVSGRPITLSQNIDP